MKRVIRVKASGKRVRKVKCGPGKKYDHNAKRCVIITAADALKKKRASKKMVRTKKKRVSQQRIGVRAMKRARAKRKSAGL